MLPLLFRRSNLGLLHYGVLLALIFSLTAVFTTPAAATQPILWTVPGTDQHGGCHGIAVASNGELYVASDKSHRVYKIAKDGTITNIAGTGKQGFSGDNRPAINARLNSPSGIAIGNNNEIYITDNGNNRIRKISTNGIITTAAGNGRAGYNGDNIKAIRARLHSPDGLTVDNSGVIYFADTGNHRIRKISRNGTISTIAGTGHQGFNGDGSAMKAELNWPCDVAVGPGGEVYIADTYNNCIRMVSITGVISTIAGPGPRHLSMHNTAASDSDIIQPLGVVVKSDGTIYFSNQGQHYLRKISRETITTIAGDSQPGSSARGIRATVPPTIPGHIAIGTEGEIFIADNATGDIRAIGPNDGLETLLRQVVEHSIGRPDRQNASNYLAQTSMLEKREFLSTLAREQSLFFQYLPADLVRLLSGLIEPQTQWRAHLALFALDSTNTHPASCPQNRYLSATAAAADAKGNIDRSTEKDHIVSNPDSADNLFAIGCSP